MKPVAVITGAGHGIGRALAIQLSRDGYAIGAIDVDGEALTRLTTEIGALTQVADVTDAAALARAIQSLESNLGPAYLMVANAGIGIETSALDFRAADFERVIRINLLGVSNSVAAVLPGMIQRRAGHLVGLSSLASFRGLPRLLAYSTSKAGVSTLFEGLRAELRPFGIHVTTICPGWIRTRMTAPIAKDLPDILELEDGMREIVAAIRGRKSYVAFPRGTALRLRVLRMLPRAWQDRIIAGMSKKPKPIA
jgi:NAD(P)-dependent dehydrogenase (short-subunit alcohol dehydrogenase family)